MDDVKLIVAKRTKNLLVIKILKLVSFIVLITAAIIWCILLFCYISYTFVLFQNTAQHSAAPSFTFDRAYYTPNVFRPIYAMPLVICGRKSLNDY